MSTKRITKEFAEVSQNPPEGFSVSLPPNQSIHTWHITLRPPPSTPFHPGTFGLVLSLPTDYPFKPPIVKFVTRIYHPNVTNDSLGNICLGLLKSDNWKPSTKLYSVLEAIRNLLVEPQPDDPLEESIAEEYRNNREEWAKKVKQNVDKYAKSEPTFPPLSS
ncbi:ubiquitin-conjugating enzyme/RWD-like protein [Mariannaea sp. PMI_226]|nr:ubiquitin-conjugating enzyme/RWD-like protein [Mariannaea sp. PMI_226]